MGDIWHKYLAVESEIHFDKDQQEIEAFFGAWQDQGFYEDGLFTLQHRDFESDDLFSSAYKSAIQHATSTNSDPHIRWRARIFEYFLKTQLPGKCGIHERQRRMSEEFSQLKNQFEFPNRK